MAKHNELECAWCAEDLTPEESVTGRDYKVYCSAECAETGARMSEAEAARWFRSQIPPDQLQFGLFSSRR